MASDVVYSAVRTWLEANWSTTTIKWENETFTEPTPTEHPTAPAAFIMVELVGQSYDQMSIGSGTPSAERWAEEGAVLIHCLVQSGAGSLVARQNATALAVLLRGLQLPNDIRFRAMSIGDGGIGDEDGTWWALTLRAEWTRG